MEVFGAILTTGSLIIQFVGACTPYSDRAKSLKARFEWDLRALAAIRDYFLEKRCASNAVLKLSLEDAILLERTSAYLDGLACKVHHSLSKIERKGFLAGIINRGMWVARKADLEDLEKELFDWTQRFDVRVLGLPPEIKTIIPTAPDANPSRVLKSHNRLSRFLELESSAKRARANQMRLEHENIDAVSAAWVKISAGPVYPCPPVSDEDKQVIFATRKVSSTLLPGTRLFNDLDFEVGVLAAALNCLDPDTDIRLLRVESYFYHHERREFIFKHISPHPVTSIMTLEDTINADRFPDSEVPLNERFQLAYKLAEAILFLHAAGFVHKNITSSSIVTLRRNDLACMRLGNAYLMGFDLIRGVDARTSNEGAVKRDEAAESTSIWNFDIFQHPDRLRGENSQRYTKTYDIYSLGVVLLQIGSWEPLSEIASSCDQEHPAAWPEELSDAACRLNPRTGERFRRLVQWCLALDGTTVVRETEFVEEVLDPLEELVIALS